MISLLILASALYRAGISSIFTLLLRIPLVSICAMQASQHALLLLYLLLAAMAWRLRSCMSLLRRPMSFLKVINAFCVCLVTWWVSYWRRIKPCYGLLVACAISSVIQGAW